MTCDVVLGGERIWVIGSVSAWVVKGRFSMIEGKGSSNLNGEVSGGIVSSSLSVGDFDLDLGMDLDLSMIFGWFLD